ncbi:Uncharacterized protein FWK35_00033513 [Aphis craccivora]|uniref:Uncharacterized protein n=1 Tax=Aphis craccivora TaxID=307492 RepID=A0A6G0VPF4_APHCR|nr:Uncharacterized protein FWK35_00033513 [Aphis craccivora]
MNLVHWRKRSQKQENSQIILQYVQKILYLIYICYTFFSLRNINQNNQVSHTHPMFGFNMPIFCLKSRKSFLKTSEILTEDPSLRRIILWRDQIVDTSWGMEPAGQLLPGHQLE